MNSTFLGLPWSLWGVVCLLVAGMYLIVWPGRKPRPIAPPRPLWRHVILRWFHALVWVLLALSCFVRANQLPGGPATADVMALVALVLYVAFVSTVVIERRLRR